MEDIDLTTILPDSDAHKELKDDAQKKTMESAVREQRTHMPYVTASSCHPLGVVVPTKLAYETMESLKEFYGQGIDTTDIVKSELVYSSKLTVDNAFGAEQVDAIALAIKQIKVGKGFIVGDMPGIGKGRICAGIMRYAKQQGKIPVFISAMATLFSDIYRDIENIGMLESGGKFPVPFILNDGENASIQRGTGEDSKTIFRPLTTKKTVQLCVDNTTGELPKGYDLVMLTYSQIGANIQNPKQANAKAKYDFLKALMPNAILIMDESHKGAGQGSTAENVTELIALAKGVVFASATYSKVPESMIMYMPKTDIWDSNIRPKTIVDAVRQNGEVVQEYVAGLLVKSGQMIRRERTFEGCTMAFMYDDTKPKEKYYEQYDRVMQIFNDIDKFCSSDLYKKAHETAIQRYAKIEGIKIVAPTSRRPPSNPAERAKWDAAHKLEYLPTFRTNSILRNKFNWIEELLFSLKADYVADTAIQILKTQVENVKYVIGSEVTIVKTNSKPVIAIRSTSEASLKNLGYKAGDRIKKEENYYGRTLIKLLNGTLGSVMTFKPVIPSEKRKTIDFPAQILLDDFEDKGKTFSDLMVDVLDVVGEIPLSPIDHIINKIQSTYRGNDNEFNKTNEFYQVEEVTQRSLSISPNETGGDFTVVSKKKERSHEKIKRFNSGQSDVIIINTAGSIGVSLHSSVEFKDRRPRHMLIHQVELDVATEVQKRGRVNRTGQITLPGYWYIVSPVPSEIRKLMMLRRKMRSLDANVAGNAKQSAKASQILDAEGKEIEDMSNKYGYALLHEFLDEPGNEMYKDVSALTWRDAIKNPEEQFESYLRAVEALSCKDQETFYDRMNKKYIAFKITKGDDWDIEMNIEKLNASTRNKKILYSGDETNEFTKSVYIEDKYASPKGIPYTKKEMEDRESELAGGMKPSEFHANMIEEYGLFKAMKLQSIKSSYGEPDTSMCTTEDEIKETILAHEEKVRTGLLTAEQKIDATLWIIKHFTIGKLVELPGDLTELDDGWKNPSTGLRKSLANFTIGKVLGYKLSSKDPRDKFLPMNIEIEFASPKKIMPMLRVSLTKSWSDILYWIQSGAKIFSKEEAKSIREWEITAVGQREKIRVITGELFRGFEIADELIKNDPDNNYLVKKRLIKYTTTGSTIEAGIKLWQEKPKDLSEGVDKVPIYAALNGSAVIKQLEDSPGKVFWLASYKEYIRKNDFGFYEIGFSLGRWKTQKGKISTISKYVSNFATQDVLDAIKDATGQKFNFYTEPLMEDVLIASTFRNIPSMEFMRFTSYKVDKFLDILTVIYQKYKVLIKLKPLDQQDTFILFKAPDAGAELDEEQGEAGGEYSYYIRGDWGRIEEIPNYIDGSFEQMSDPRNPKIKGRLKVKFKVTPVECRSLNILPDVTESEGMRNLLLSLPDDASRIKFKASVAELGDEYSDIAFLASKALGVDFVYAFGSENNRMVGKIIAENINVPLDVETGKKIDIYEGIMNEKIPLNWDSAQDFIIKIQSL